MKKERIAAVLLFCSGMCALIYQIAWLRELRLVFGASTLASGAVLAIFMGGLGVGGWWLGKKADKTANPLRMYAWLELIVAVSSAFSPLLIKLIREMYIWSGGAITLGAEMATVVRLVLSVLVLAVPTIAMGGTFPAISRFVENESDSGRRRLSILYGVNTLGALTGAFICSFLLLEHLGIMRSIWLAAMINLIVVVVARNISQKQSALSADPEGSKETPVATPVQRKRIRLTGIMIGAFVSGFVFFLMEIIWYRMLSPVLGGSTFTFSTILIVALLGIGVGGLLHAFRSRSVQATWQTFAFTCVLEALLLIIPFAIGDWIPVWASMLSPLGNLGFWYRVGTWAVITVGVVFPASVVAGYQFPVMIGLMGKGGENVGQDAGWIYAANTAGAIVGSLAGGFGLLPLLGAVALWRFSAFALIGLCVLCLLYSLREEVKSLRKGAVIFGCIVLTIFLASAHGPTAAWRHQGIGAGRVSLVGLSYNQVRNWMIETRRSICFEADGRESTLGISSTSGYAFIINGKVDGHAIGDAPTQVMSGLISGCLHPNPRTAAVIGLGTGSTVGWLAQIPSVERVDAIELEPAVLEMARRCASINGNVLKNPKVNMIFNDARETLLTIKQSYELIVSEPSNPFRAGIASIYTKEFYEAVRLRLSKDGIFTQWVQAYEVDSYTVRTILATLRTVFPNVQIWKTNSKDMMILCTNQPLIINAEVLSRKTKTEPFRTALNYVWGGDSLEGFLSHFVANENLIEAIFQQEGDSLNTDDKMVIEFGFARAVNEKFQMLADIAQSARKRNWHRPLHVTGAVDWSRVDFLNEMSSFAEGQNPILVSENMKVRMIGAGDIPPQGSLPASVDSVEETHMEVLAKAEYMARSNHPQTEIYLNKLAGIDETEGLVCRAIYGATMKNDDMSLDQLEKAFGRFRRNPWPKQYLMNNGLDLALNLAKKSKAYAKRVFAMMESPFELLSLQEKRLACLLEVSRELSAQEGLKAIQQYGAYYPWNLKALIFKRDIYQKLGDREASAKAQMEIGVFLQRTPIVFDDTLQVYE